jgi:hypothetical protein
MSEKGKEEVILQDTSSLLAIGSQSVKKVQFSHEETGIDGG